MSNKFGDFKFPQDSKVDLQDNMAIVTKWNWDYLESLNFQKKAQEFIQSNRDLKIYIFCNHPHCFTLGRGNERGNDELVEFDESLNLNYQIFKIHRGGGITFHYPGQWIFYPIVDINQKQTLDDLMCWMLKGTKDVLTNLGMRNIITAKKLMGVWKDKKKLASIGLGLNRFVTEHGLALNLIYDKDMFNELSKINPCGINSQTYVSADQYISSESLIEKFHNEFISKILLS